MIMIITKNFLTLQIKRRKNSKKRKEKKNKCGKKIDDNSSNKI